MIVSLITSQNDTTPKREIGGALRPRRLITSQNDTTPKPRFDDLLLYVGLITSQNDTTPKLLVFIYRGLMV